MVGKRSRMCVCVSQVGCFALAVPLIALSLFAVPASPTEAKNKRTIQGQASTKLSPAYRNVSSTSPALMLTPNQIQFSEVPVGEFSSQMVRLTNTGESLLQIKRILAPGLEFRIEGQVIPFVIAKGTSADFTISYRPKSAGRASAHVWIYTSEHLEPFAAELVASDVSAQEELVASVANLDFAEIPAGSRAVKEISLMNVGNCEVAISGVRVIGDDSFGVTGPEGLKLKPGQKIDLAVTLQATTLGLRSGALKVSEKLEIPLTAVAVPASSRMIKLQWEGDLETVPGYVVYRSADATGPYEQIASALAATEYLDSGLAPGHTYYYMVASSGSDDTENESSLPISVTVPEG